MNLSPPLGVLAGVVARPIIKCNQNFISFINNVQILGILLGDFLIYLEGVFLGLQSFFFVGVFPDILLVKEAIFFDEFKL